MSVVEVSHVTKRFGKTIILENINLSFKKGEIVGLIGPSGSGKTTLVKCMIGMEHTNEGMIQILDTPIPNRRILSRIGYMAQSDALYLELSGRQNLEFFAKLFDIPKKERHSRIDYVSSLVNLEKDLNKNVVAYSGGMKRRLSLAIALIQDPEILILDEPTVGIDPQLRRSIWEELYKLKSQGKSIIVTTHVMDEAEKCDRLALIRKGKIMIMGAPEALKDKYQVSTIEEIFLLVGGGRR